MIEFLDDGRVVLQMDEGPFTLRRPKYGEFKQFRLSLNEKDAELARAREKYAPSENETPEEKTVRVEALNDTVGGIFLAWLREVGTALGDQPWPGSDDDVPAPFVFSNDLIGRVVRHWQTVPLGPGPNGQGR